MFDKRLKTHHSAMAEGKEYVMGMTTLDRALEEENKCLVNNSTIYIHVPFCNKICSFCNMRRSLSKPVSDYADIICREIENYAGTEYIKSTVFDAVYFGGGTPTTMTADALCKIIRALKANFHFTADAEFTIETTVTELTDEKADQLVEAGVNRFSVGVQTFDNVGRKKMGRIGSGEAAYDKLKKLKSYNNVTVSMDLIYNYAGQTLDNLRDDLHRISELNLDSFSMYSLINMKDASIDEAQNEKNDEMMFYTIADIMKAQGYRFLELTKMVKTDKYKYIMNRHKGADTLPLGAGAGGSVNDVAMMNPIKIEEYSDAVYAGIHKRQGMRFKPSYRDIVRFKGDIQTIHLPKNESLYKDMSKYMDIRDELMNEQMISKIDDNTYRLTDKGVFWGNSISRYLSELI